MRVFQDTVVYNIGFEGHYSTFTVYKTFFEGVYRLKVSYRGVGLIRTVLIRTIGLIRTVFREKSLIYHF